MKTLTLLLLIIISGCSVFNADDDFRRNPLSGETGLSFLEGTSGKQTLQEARDRWNSLSSDTYTYSFTHMAQRGVFGTNKFVVKENIVTDIKSLESDESVDSEYLDFYKQFTIDGLFDHLEKTLNEAAEVRIKFSEKYGYPVSIYIDYHKSAIDDEQAFLASDYIK